MSFVLILNSDINAKPPAVVGGFRTLEAAERAGDLATLFDTENKLGSYFIPMPYYTHYTVIPAADEDPIESLHCSIERDGDGKPTRHKKHWHGPYIV